MSKSLSRYLRALGTDELPDTVVLDGTRYRKIRQFKHDFFAGTGLYESPAGRIVVKFGRTASLFGLPLKWLGALLVDHEVGIYRRLEGIRGVPALVGRIGRTGFAHAYIEGGNLRERPEVDEAFFDRLAALLRAIHARDVAYADLEKRTNIVVGADGWPYLVDFQIAWYLRPNRGGRTWPARAVLGWLQRGDWYHLRKHQARHRPDLMSPWEIEELLNQPRIVRWYSRPARALTWLRRWVLWRLGQRADPSARSEETQP